MFFNYFISFDLFTTYLFEYTIFNACRKTQYLLDEISDLINIPIDWKVQHYLLIIISYYPVRIYLGW